MDLTTAVTSLGNDYVNKVSDLLTNNSVTSTNTSQDSTFDSIFNSVSGLLDSTNNYIQQAQQAETDELMDWGSNGAPPSKAVRMASTVVATVPILCVYPFIQKFFTQGVMVGAVKG